MGKNTEFKNINELVVDKQVLVVEDDEGLNKLIQKALRRAGFDCFGVLSGADAIERVRKNPNQVLLIDQQLPDMDGTDLVRNLTKHTHDIIFVAMTGHGDEKIAVEMMKLGARDYLIKGFDLTDILPMVFNRVFSELEIEQKLTQAEKALIESEEKYKTLFERESDAIFIYDPDTTHIVDANKATSTIYGYTHDELIGMSCLKFSAEIEKSASTIEKMRERDNVNVPIRFHCKKDGAIFPIEIKNSAITLKGQRVMYAVCKDISKQRQAEDENKKLEIQLHQAQKMESIGTLAGGIAHDFNNILFPIVGHTEMLLEDVPEDSPIRPSLEEIYTSSLRAKDLVKQILTFSRQENTELKQMKMQPIIKEALKLIRSTIPTTIEIKQDISPACGVIKADSTQIHQIVINLATNAYHAMEDMGGELIVSLKEIKLGVLDLINPDMTPGQYACLTVADTGTGMDKELTQKIFDPFFTTKAVGKGTGMGLSVVHGIVAGMGGAVRLYSQPGKGTQFYVYFPIEKNSFVKHSVQTRETIQGGIERILLVDDEDAIIIMEKLMLERLGYQVTSRTSSIEALEVFRDSPDKFRLVITDMAMPNMPGDKLSVELNKIRPDIPILLCTGFSETMSEEKAASLGIKGFLLKPIVMKDLAQKIREVLDSNKTENTN